MCGESEETNSIDEVLKFHIYGENDDSEDQLTVGQVIAVTAITVPLTGALFFGSFFVWTYPLRLLGSLFPFQGQALFGFSLIGLKYFLRLIKQRRHEKFMLGENNTDFDAWLIEKSSSNQQVGGRSSSSQQNGGPSVESQQKLLGIFFRDCFAPGSASNSLNPSRNLGSPQLVAYYEGISVKWLKDVFFQIPEVKKCNEFGCEVWYFRDVFLIEFLSRQRFEGRSLLDWAKTTYPQSVAKSNRFISYTGGYRLKTLFDFVKEMNDETVVWLDLFSVNQFMWRDKTNPQAVKEKKEFRGKLRECVRSAGFTTLLLERWNDLVAIQKIWVVWEVFNTIKAEVELEILAPGSVEEYLIAWLEKGSIEKVHLAVKQIDINEASASSKDDRTAILEDVRQSTGGIEGVNFKVKERLYVWYESVTRAATRASDFRFLNRETMADRFIAEMLMGQGHLDKARDHLASCLQLKPTKKRYARLIIPALCLLSDVESQLGNHNEAAEVAEHALRIAKDNRISLSEEAAYATFKLGCAEVSKRDYSKGKATLQTSLRLMSSRSEKPDQKNILIMLKLAEIPMFNGEEFQLAETLLTHVLDVATEHLGCDDLLTLRIATSLALCKGKLEGGQVLSLQLLSQVYKKSLQLFGADHPRTSKTKKLLEELEEADEPAHLMLFHHEIRSTREIFEYTGSASDANTNL